MQLETPRPHQRMIRNAGAPEDVARLMRINIGANTPVRTTNPNAVRAILRIMDKESCNFNSFGLYEP